jgi:hypothetical protein
MFWIVTNGRYRIIGENVLNNTQNTIVTLGKTTSVANIVIGGVLIKEKPIVTSRDSKFLVPIVKSLFINLCDSSNKDGLSLLDVVVPISVNSQVNEKHAFQMKVLFMNF